MPDTPMTLATTAQTILESEEQMIHIFIQFTETAFWISRSLSSNQIIFSKRRIIFHQPQKKN
jgi:hypothetical protein